MSIDNYISYVFSDEIPESVYQYKSKHKPGYVPTDDLRDFYYSYIYLPAIIDHSGIHTLNNLSNKLRFLDYHYYKFSGNTIDFLDFIESTIDQAEHYQHYNIIAHHKKRMDKNILKWIDEKKGQVLTEPEKTLLGFDCNLSLEALEYIHSKMTEKKFIRGDLRDFKAIFNNKPISNIKPLVWLLQRNKQGNKKALSEFLFQMLGEINLNSRDNTQRIACSFIDTRNNKMNISKPDKRYFSKYFKDFETIIKTSKEKTRPA